MGRKIYVGADGGGSKTAICALGCLPGNQVFSCQGASMNYNVIGVEKAAVHFAEAMSRLPMARGMEIAAVAIGDPSIDDLVPSPLTGQFLNRVRQLVPPLSMCPIYVASDVYMTLYGMTGGEPGAIMVSGTGSMGLAQDPKGRLHVVAGWGRLIEGEGSGYFIASRGLRAALRYYEGTGPKTVLLEEMKRYFGIQDPRDFVLRYYADSTAFPDVAGFAKVVGDAAGQDEEAKKILLECGDILVTGMCTLLQKAGLTDCKVGVYGSVLLENSLVRKVFERGVLEAWPRVTIMVPKLKPEAAALQYSMEKEGV